ncbi:hypothetical protein [Ekhidna sp. To15]|uniref:hypothetical protein n=1 Tax=Ekhidna sp. To15 TaxID=3395267 RepID=UPI003F51E45B
MKEYSIKSQNLNDSLVFYRALFNTMPERLGIDFLEFNTSQFRLKIAEGKSRSHQMLTMKIEKAELNNIHNRMKRFLLKERLKENCEVIDKAIGLIDPDGNYWRVGDLTSDVQFEKCYVTD